MKRKRKAQRDTRVTKRQKNDQSIDSAPTWPLLQCYYHKVLTLRQYLVWTLTKSKKRQRKLLHYGLDGDKGSSIGSDAALVKLLDTTVIGTPARGELLEPGSIDNDIAIFTQQLSEVSATISPTQGAFKQSEIVDFSLWLIFRRHYGYYNPSHLLCHGFQKQTSAAHNGMDLVDIPGVPGIRASSANRHIEVLKSYPWTALPRLLGKGAERIIGDMLLQCGIFEPVASSSNLTQLSGIPLSSLKQVKDSTALTAQAPNNETGQVVKGKSARGMSQERGLSSIRFVRHRILYARPILSSKCNFQFGMDLMHVLNRYEETENEHQTSQIMKYVFPRQFGLHNVFTSKVDRNETAQAFKDYTVREEEIERSDLRWKQVKMSSDPTAQASQRPLPKRLRGEVLILVRKLRKRHSSCSYKSMLDHYCPRTLTPGSDNSINQALSLAQVSAFCRAVVSKVFPKYFWGRDDAQTHNREAILKMIDRFVRLRRYETMSLHDVLQDINISGIPWLAPQQSQTTATRLSRSDWTKRKELLAELLYYLFDSFLIPLIRGHFYVTESSGHRNQLFYFRHDVWRAISNPAIRSLKDTMFEPCISGEVESILAKRELGVSHVRMLPKEQGMRPIINLRRRVQGTQYGRLTLGKSVNKLLTPAFSVLNCEKVAHPNMLASALFSVEDMYPRLQAFREALERRGVTGQPLFFAKVDVKACFDSIPQKHLIELVRTIIGSDVYHVAKYSRGKLLGGHNDETPGFGTIPYWKHLTTAASGNEGFNLGEEVQNDTTDGRTRTVYVDGNNHRLEHRRFVLKLLEDHVESNLIRFGNQFYRQKEGIPQGSIVSSLLCSFFYAKLEREALEFINDGESMLLRLIDDFLVISTKQKVAERFIRTMHNGLPKFGVQIKAEKSRANFEIEIDGKAIHALPRETDFPYCGNAINTVTLNLSKDKERRKQSNIGNSTTVEYSKLPGQNFYRKTLNALKMNMQAMLLSTRYNNLSTVLSNLHHCFTEVAQKTYHYIRSLPANKQPDSKLVIKAVDDLIKLACVLMKRRRRTSKDLIPYECCVKNAQARWLACTAFLVVFRQRQTKHRVLLHWIEEQLALSSIHSQKKVLENVVGPSCEF